MAIGCVNQLGPPTSAMNLIKSTYSRSFPGFPIVLSGFLWFLNRFFGVSCYPHLIVQANPGKLQGLQKIGGLANIAAKDDQAHLVGGILNPSEKYDFVSWDDYSQYMET